MQVGLFTFRRILCGFMIVLSITLCGILYILFPFPKNEVGSGEYPQSFHIALPNKFEQQPPNQCSAYATAYILRNFGQEAQGEEVYKKIPFKIPISGYVLPKGIITYMKSFGLKPEIWRGELPILKSKLSEGVPVIVLIGKGLQWQHYMTLVGYDSEKKELYFYDSKKITDENDSSPGNRTLTEEYFMTLWNNGLPIFNRVFITVSR